MYVQAAQSYQPTIKLLEKAGLIPLRFSWIMMKDLKEYTPEPSSPEAIRITSYKEESDLETILKVVDEAFADHWGYIDQSGDQERIERFRYSIDYDDQFDPSLWFLAMDGDEIAGVALCNSHIGPDSNAGYVETLAVRSRWRKQGLGLALLHHTFGKFLQRNYKRVNLGVDTQSLTGATRLYYKAGMQVTRELAVYEKELRPGVELSKQE